MGKWIWRPGPQIGLRDHVRTSGDALQAGWRKQTPTVRRRIKTMSRSTKLGDVELFTGEPANKSVRLPEQVWRVKSRHEGRLSPGCSPPVMSCSLNRRLADPTPSDAARGYREPPQDERLFDFLRFAAAFSPPFVRGAGRVRNLGRPIFGHALLLRPSYCLSFLTLARVPGGHGSLHSSS